MAATAALVFAGKSVATPAISFIVNKAFGYLSEWYKPNDLEELKNNLSEKLTDIQAVYDVVDHQEISEQSNGLAEWLWRFRDAVEEAEDALDEMDYHKLKEEAEAHSLGQIVGKAARMTPEGNMVEKLREAIERLESVAKDLGGFLQLLCRVDNLVLQDRAERSVYQTSSTLVPIEIFGRDSEKNQVIRWLTDNVHDDPDTVTQVPVFAIIGIGGIGKTTLAQIVCEELKDSAHFDCILWVHVSDNVFSSTRIMKKILEAVTKEKPNADTLEALQQILKDKLGLNKVLLILDDVWEDSKMIEWETLMAPLRSIQRGSKILLTTRMRSVADMKYAFDGLNSEDYAHLLPIAEKIAKKFHGCPLVTKIAGGHLQNNISDQHWEGLHRQLEHLEGSTDVIITTVLRSSYHHLPEHLQLCFRYCSIFPKNHKFKKVDIVKMWMGSGLILQTEGGTERPEDMGGRYFVQLARKSFFTFVPTVNPYQKYSTEYYVMHDLLHELARNVSTGECLRLESGGFLHHKCTVRHLWIANFSKLSCEEIKAISCFKSLRTLVMEDSYHVSTGHVYALEEVIEKLKCLRLLSLKGVTKFCFPKEVANKHLRYISFSTIEKIHGLSKLYHLQVLIAAKRIGTASEQVENMENLFHLRYVSYGTNGFGQCPVGRLTSLQELYNFSIQSKEGYRISSLMNLTSLCKLRLCNLENVERHEEVIEAKINEKSYLRSLSLNWSETNDALKEDNLVLDILEPHARLENLEITGYSGVRFPPWINHPPLVNMVSLELRQCKNWVCLPSLGNLQLLKHLELQNLTGLKQIGQSSGDSLPQNLKTLVVEGCQGLRKLPLLPLTLMQLEINNVGLDILPRIVVHHGNIGSEAMPPKLVSVIISNCSNLTTLAESFLLQEHYICTLQILKIVDCKKLIHAPLSFGSMNDLTEFRIGSCYSLRMMERVDGGLLPCTLKELSMVQCGDLQLPLLNSLVGLSNLTSLSLCNCSRVKSLPSSEVFRSLTALREMVIMNCIFLSSLGGLGALSYLSWLEITDCECVNQNYLLSVCDLGIHLTMSVVLYEERELKGKF
ncbi:putative disease resistance protein RGA4 [Triticum aestivum]|uniref:putative disease resistance protein RGA4 n=1 Tax=Triticum aestivum TaxID=4565 RepID=UPI001D007D16|nr:putative disease resistance protein RGA4 [Triticum aestivum]